MPDLRGRVVLIAGATSASGAAATRALVAHGARVVAAGRDGAKLAELAQLGASVEVCDLTDEQAVAALAERVGAVDGVLHQVGGWRGGGGLAGQSDDDFRVLEQSLTALRVVSRAFDAGLARSSAAREAIVSSTAVDRPLAGGANYAAVKAASEAWAQAVAHGFEKAARDAGEPLRAASVIFRVKGLDGLEDTLAQRYVDLWDDDAAAVNGTVIDLTVATDRGFASDNYSGAHPDVLAAIVAANHGHQVAYGEDEYTTKLQEVIRSHFGDAAEAFPMFNGTGTNVTALQSMLPRWGAVIAAYSSHINFDEQGAPERIGGMKLLTVAAEDGKLTPELIDREAWGWGDVHRAQPLVVSVAQSTEVGTLYTPDELRAITDHAHARGMWVHVDGARLANAAAALDVPLRAITTDVGIDVLSLGATKNGATGAEAIVVLNPEASTGLAYLRKLNMQLASKMRFVSAQLLALLDGDLWQRNARHANAMAQRLRAGIEAGLADGSITGVEFTQPTQSNGVFAILPEGVADRLRTDFRFYDWDPARREVRWMCTFDTTAADVERFVAAVARETSA